MSVSVGSITAAGKRILRVYFREITPDCYSQIRGLRISPQKPGYFSKGDAENPTFRGSLRPRLCENAMVGIIRRSQHKAKPNEAFH
jgi:hypothetical protein